MRRNPKGPSDGTSHSASGPAPRLSSAQASSSPHAGSGQHAWKPLSSEAEAMERPSCRDCCPSPARDQSTAGHTRHFKSQPLLETLSTTLLLPAVRAPATLKPPAASQGRLLWPPLSGQVVCSVPRALPSSPAEVSTSLNTQS